MKRTKWLPFFGLSVVLLASSPLSVQARDLQVKATDTVNQSDTEGTSDAADTTAADLWLDGNRLQNGTTKIGTGSIELNTDTHTLILSNISNATSLNITDTNDYQLIIKGNCSFGSTVKPTGEIAIFSENSNLNIQIEKNSSLSLYTEDNNNILVDSGSLTITGPGKLTGKTTGESAYPCLSAEKNLALKEQLKASLTSASHGLYCNTGSVNIDSADVNIQAARYGILAEGYDYATDSISSAGAAFKSSTVTIDTRTGDCGGIFTGSDGVTIDNSTLNIQTSKDAEEDLGSNAYSIYTSGDIHIGGSATKLDISDASGMATDSGDFTITDGQIKITSTGSALYSWNNLTIQGGTIQATSETDSAIASKNGKLTIDGKNTSVTATSGSKNYAAIRNIVTGGIYLNADITARNTAGGTPVQGVKQVTAPGITIGSDYPQFDTELYTDADGKTYFVKLHTTDYLPFTGTLKLYIPKVSSVKLSSSSNTYSGRKYLPAITARDNKNRLIPETDYNISYPSGCKKVGKYTVKLTFKGYYKGTYTKTFTIVPKKTSLRSLKSAKKGFLVKWKKQTTETSGYQIQYATNKKFTKNVKYKTISGNKTTLKNVQKLKTKKTYYVRIRTYKKVQYNKKTIRIYSGWSKIKKIKTK